MKKISIAIMVLVVVLASCKKTPEVNLKYVDVERDLITVGTTTATVQCDYQYIATLKKAYLCYGEGENEDNFSSAEMRVVQNTLYVDLAGLTANTTYNYYYEFHNGFNSMRTALKTFKTEGGSGPSVVLPTVVTGEVTEITTSSAKGSGEVTQDGGAEVTERGVCWSTSENPTVDDNHVAAGTGTGDFTAMMNGLEADTTYHVRAYATNEVGTAYGLDREFMTVGGGGSGIPEGAINGLFTINERGDQVYFSQGNLQYQASTNTWRFAEHQTSFVGGVWDGTEWGNVYENGIKCNNSRISPDYDGWIDHFAWASSGWDSGNTYYHPWDYIYSASDGDLYGPPELCNLTGDYVNCDWGHFNAISNGGGQINQWRTFTREEWDYVAWRRVTPSGILFAFAQVDNVDGVILLPDNWNASIYNLANANIEWAQYDCNIINSTQWNILEDAGAVFLPAAGRRIGTSVIEFNNGFYWSVSCSRNRKAFAVEFNETTFYAGYPPYLYYGLSVRLVQDAN